MKATIGNLTIDHPNYKGVLTITRENEFDPGGPIGDMSPDAKGEGHESEEPGLSMLNVTVIYTEKEDISRLRGIRGALLTYELNNGQSWQIPKGMCTGNPTLSTSSGEVPVVFKGNRAKRLR